MIEHDITSLYERYSVRLTRYARVRVGSEEEAEDIVQSVFLELCRGKAVPRTAENVEAYLLGIAAHLAARHIRRKQRQKRIARAEPFRYHGPVGQASPSQRDAERIQMLLARLSPKAREALKLRFIEGMTPKEAGAKLGCSEHTFCQRVHDAVRALRELAQPEGRS